MTERMIVNRVSRHAEEGSGGAEGRGLYGKVHNGYLKQI